MPMAVVRKQDALQAPLFDKRAALISRVPDFWALVFEQAPPEIDQYISPSDSAALAALSSFQVTRFEIASDTASGISSNGDPRSVSFKFEFGENQFFDDKVLEKKFWHRRAEDGWTGLVSEPVKINWKAGKDLTGGMLDMAVGVWERQMTRAHATTAGAIQGPVKEYDQLVRRVKQMNAGSVSFFAWFGFRGRDVSAYESARATKKEEQRRERVKSNGVVVEGSNDEVDAAEGQAAEGGNGKVKADGSDEDRGGSEEEIEDEDMGDGEVTSPPEMEREIFPGGEDLAVSLSEDLFPGAIKYFSECNFQADIGTRLM